jgi:hypothetical protein
VASASHWIMYGGASFSTTTFDNSSMADMRLGFIAYDAQILVTGGSYAYFYDAASTNTGGYGVVIDKGSRALAAILWGKGNGAAGCYIGVSSQLEGTVGNNRYILGAANGVKVGTVAAGAWPAVVGTLTADPASLAAFMHA